MLLSAVSVLVVAQSSSEISEGLMNNPVYLVYVVHRNAGTRKKLTIKPRQIEYSSTKSAQGNRV